MIERAEIESRIRSAEINRNQSDPRTMMLTLKADTETASDAIDRDISRQLERLQSELRDRASVRTRETNLLPLEMERDSLLEKFGPRHPKIVGIQREIDVVEKKIARMESEEDEKEAMIKKIMTLGGKPDEELDPEAELPAIMQEIHGRIYQHLQDHYRSGGESRAYAATAPMFHERVAAIRARAEREGWT